MNMKSGFDSFYGTPSYGGLGMPSGSQVSPSWKESAAQQLANVPLEQGMPSGSQLGLSGISGKNGFDFSKAGSVLSLLGKAFDMASPRVASQPADDYIPYQVRQLEQYVPADYGALLNKRMADSYTQQLMNLSKMGSTYGR